MDDGRLVSIHGFGLAIYITSVIFVSISTLVVCLRVYVRWTDKLLWWDDALMFIGLVVFCIDVALGCRSAAYGLGNKLEDLTDFQWVEARRYLTIWMLLYPICLAFVKSSICMTLLRLAETLKYIRISVYVLLGLTVVSSSISIISGLIICRPYANHWDFSIVVANVGTCSAPNAVFGIAYATTSVTIATDITCAILPAIILWKTQLQLKTKLLVSLLLSFGSFASVCTMIRTPYIKYYADRELVYWLSNVVLWSNIEIAIGLIAGSVPVFQKLIMSRAKKQNTPRSPIPLELMTFGSTPMKSRRRTQGDFSNPTDAGFSMATVHASHNSRDWERLEDDSSEGTCVIRTEFTYDVERSHVPESLLVGRNG